MGEEVRLVVVVATVGGWPWLGQHEWRYQGGEGGVAMRGDACTRRRREARVGTEEEEGAESAAAEGVAPEGSAEAGGVLEAQEAPSWLQPCRGRACRHLRITGGGLHETRLAGGQGTRQGNG